MNDYADLDSAVSDYIRANAGWGSAVTGVVAAGQAKALAFAQSLDTTQVA